MNDEITRLCPYCKEEIKVAAKICPRCRQWLSVFSLRNPAVLTTVVYLSLLVWTVGFQIFLQRLVNPGIDFSPYRDGITIIESRMNVEDAGGKSSVHVVAVITNQTDIAWKQVQFDVRFFNKMGVLIDARGYSAGDTILPHGEIAFRINTKPIHALSDYESYKIFVRSARDARCLLNN
jgi:hypothetical protein